MKITGNILKQVLVPVLVFVIDITAGAQVFRHMGRHEGLSNSSVSCIYIDRQRLLYAGTFDGLNKFDGAEITTFKPDLNNPHSLSSNVVRCICGADDGRLWVLTKEGLVLFDPMGKVLKLYKEIPENSIIATDSRQRLLVLLPSSGTLKIYAGGQFLPMQISSSSPSRTDICRPDKIVIGSDDAVYLRAKGGAFSRYRIEEKGSSFCLVPDDSPLPDYGRHMFEDNGTIAMIDDNGAITVIDENSGILADRIPSGSIGHRFNTFCRLGDDLYFGHETDGLLHMDTAPPSRIENMGLHCGVFSLCTDKAQNILWIATDGQGIYSYTKEDFVFGSLNFKDLPVDIGKPIRSVIVDSRNDLWFGTKGSGLMRVRNYDCRRRLYPDEITRYHIQPEHRNPNILALLESSRFNVIWIGTNGPDFSYYSFADNQIHKLAGTEGLSLKDNHCIIEQDSCLYLSSGQKIYRMELYSKGSVIGVRNATRIDLKLHGKASFNKIYAMQMVDERYLWIGARGNGVIRYDISLDEFKKWDLSEKGIAAMNDVLSISPDNGYIWIGTSYGLSGLDPETGELSSWSENEGLVNNTVHGIIDNGNGSLWLSTNNGISMFDKATGTFTNSYNRDLDIFEYSDNAYWADTVSRRCFFGGTDGLEWIDYGDGRPSNDFIPSISCTGMQINGADADMSMFMKGSKDIMTLKIPYSLNSFSLSFSSDDYLGNPSDEFFYTINDQNEHWLKTISRKIVFTKLRSGKYTLNVKALASRQPEFSMVLHIRSPWYLSVPAFCIYILLTAAVIVSVILYLRRRELEKRRTISEELSRKYKEESYESKLQFFTNITHELCTPLALIKAPCERIMEYSGSDEQIRRYASVIHNNSDRLLRLVHEIIDFRKMETETRQLKIESCNVLKIAKDIADGFGTISTEGKINLKCEFPAQEAIFWNTDVESFESIVNNLVSNAFKYTPAGGVITLRLSIEDNCLVFSVTNTGKGIRKEDYDRIFNRYEILEYSDYRPVGNLTARNGIGMAICQGLAEALGGTIAIDSKVGKYACFTVRLPMMKTPGTIQEHDIPEAYSTQDRKADAMPSILAIDDNEDILWLLQDMLGKDYEILTARNTKDGEDILKRRHPDLVITDLMMPGEDGMNFVKRLKEDRHIAHIPIIILSAKSSVENQVEGLMSGADAYVTKPFEQNYLRAVVARCIAHGMHLKEYYTSDACSYAYIEDRLLSDEDRDFYEKCMKLIGNNISNGNFTADELASGLNVSTRTLYRKMKNLGFDSPNEFIKKRKILYSAELLKKTDLTIQEIICDSGFNTRSNFYSEFEKNFGMSPSSYRKENRRK